MVNLAIFSKLEKKIDLTIRQNVKFYAWLNLAKISKKIGLTRVCMFCQSLKICPWL